MVPRRLLLVAGALVSVSHASAALFSNPLAGLKNPLEALEDLVGPTEGPISTARQNFAVPHGAAWAGFLGVGVSSGPRSASSKKSSKFASGNDCGRNH